MYDIIHTGKTTKRMRVSQKTGEINRMHMQLIAGSPPPHPSPQEHGYETK